MDSDLPMRVLSNTFIDVLVPGGPEGLDPQHSTCTFIKFNGLGDKETHTVSVLGLLLLRRPHAPAHSKPQPTVTNSPAWLCTGDRAATATPASDH